MASTGATGGFFVWAKLANKDLHKALCRGYLSLAAICGVPIWNCDEHDCYVLVFPAGVVTFPKSLIGNLAVCDYKDDLEKVSLEVLQTRLENPMRFPLPDKKKAAD